MASAFNGIWDAYTSAASSGDWADSMSGYMQAQQRNRQLTYERMLMAQSPGRNGLDYLQAKREAELWQYAGIIQETGRTYLGVDPAYKEPPRISEDVLTKLRRETREFIG